MRCVEVERLAREQGEERQEPAPPRLTREHWRALRDLLRRGAYFRDTRLLGEAHDAISAWLGE